MDVFSMEQGIRLSVVKTSEFGVQTPPIRHCLYKIRNDLFYVKKCETLRFHVIVPLLVKLILL
jgi:hypothetical protein